MGGDGSWAQHMAWLETCMCLLAFVKCIPAQATCFGMVLISPSDGSGCHLMGYIKDGKHDCFGIRTSYRHQIYAHTSTRTCALPMAVKARLNAYEHQI